MKILMKLGGGIALLLLLVFGFLAYMGFFNSMEVKERKMGPYLYAYKSFQGPYSETGPVFDSVYKTLEQNNISTTSRGIGIYYDDPGHVEENQLRSDCGVILSPGEEEKAKGVEGLKVATLEEGVFLVTEFPLKNSLSYMLGPQKGYPALTQYANEKGYSMATPFELYDMEKGVIYYAMPRKE